MNIFPTLTITSFREKINKPTLKSNYSGGYEQVALKHTREIKTFNIGFKVLSKTEKTTLENFFKNNQALVFTFNDTLNGSSYEVQFDMDDIEFDYIFASKYSTSIVLKEV